MEYDYRGWWIKNANEYLSNFRAGAICVEYSKEDAKKIYKELPHLITASDIDQYAYALFLMNLNISKNDSYKALQIAQNLINKGNVLGNYLSAHLIFDGIVVKNVDAIAVKHLQKVLQYIPNFAPALYNLGCCYYYGKGIEKNPSLGMKYIEKANDLGFNKAVNYIARCYYDGNNNYPVNYQKALELFKQTYLRGNAEAHYYLGEMHRYGKGLSQDLNKALPYFSIAGYKGHIEAAQLAGVLQFGGKHVPLNIPEAANLLKIAAQGGKTEAMYVLALIYIVHENFNHKKDEGFEWLKKACKLGYEDAIKLANKMNIRY